MKRKFLPAYMAALIIAAAGFTSCNDDDDNDGGFHSRTITFENVTKIKDFVQSGTFQATTGTPPVIQPGASSTEIKFSAGKGQYLSFVMMYGNSKDLFFAPENPGIRLFDDNGQPILTNLSAQVKLWDSGTLKNTDPNLVAADQSSDADVMNITEIPGTDNQGFVYPSASAMMDLQMTYNATTSEFTLVIKNTSDQTDVHTPFSPGVWAVSNIVDGNLLNSAPFYTNGEATTNELTAIATMGNNVPFHNMVDSETGIITGLSPVLMVIYTGSTNPIFTVGQKDAGLGLKNIAQTGNATMLKSSLERERNVREVVVIGSSPISAGNKVTKTYEARENEKIAFATMFGYSNDWFYANNTDISALDTGNKTSLVSLYDNGTAVSQYPGAGNAQAGFTNTPVAEDVAIKMVTSDNSGFPVPSVNEIIKVTIE